MSTRGRLAGTVLFLLLFLPALAWSGGVRGTDVERILREVGETQKTIRTLQGSFRQEKTIGLLAAPEVSTGSFVYSRPNQALWSYRAPHRVEMLVSDGWLTTWYPDLDRAERIEIRRFEERIFRYLGAVSGAISDLDSYFHVQRLDDGSGRHHVLELTPKSARLGKRVRRIRVTIDRESHLTSSLEYEEGDGDTTRYDFSDLRINAPLAAGALELSLPPTVRIETLVAGSK
ncbi:MAG: LolA family protein [Thermoanaerobaculia bacterium]